MYSKLIKDNEANIKELPEVFRDYEGYIKLEDVLVASLCIEQKKRP